MIETVHAGGWEEGLVRLRPFVDEDRNSLFEAIQESADQTSPWLPELNRDLTQGHITEWLNAVPVAWQNRTAYHLAIADNRDHALIGACGLTQINHGHRFANMYYWVRSGRTGQGIASTAIRLLARFGFEVAGLQRVEIVVDVANAASLRAAAKAGATREGVLRNRLFTGNEAQDAVMFSLIPADLYN
jgi:ribosomal-protein-serine acetyltransferase